MFDGTDWVGGWVDGIRRMDGIRPQRTEYWSVCLPLFVFTHCMHAYMEYVGSRNEYNLYTQTHMKQKDWI